MTKVFFVLWIWTSTGAATDHYDTLAECQAVLDTIKKEYAGSWGREQILDRSAKCLKVEVKGE